MAQLRGKAAWVISLLYVAFVAWSLYGAVVPIETYLFRMVHMGFIFALAFLVYPFSEKAGRWGRWLDTCLVALGVASIVYALLDTDQFIRRSTVPEPADFFLGVVAILLLVEISRRAVGNAFTLVLVGFLLYVYFGRFIPGPLAHKGYDLDRIVGHMSLLQDYKNAVTPAEAGVQKPLTSLDSCFRRNDRKKQV